MLLSDLLQDLLWPRMLRTAIMALRPQRWIFCTLGLTLALLIVRLAQSTIAGRGFTAAVQTAAARAGDEISLEWRRRAGLALAGAIGRSVRALLVDIPLSHPLACVAVVLPILLLWSVGGAAACRMTAVEFGQGIILTWPRALAFGARRWSAALGAALLAPLAAAVICLILAFAGWLLLSWPYVQVLGSLLYPLSVGLCAAAVLLLAGAALSHHLMCPAVACESADALDAFQRAMAYLVASPARLLTYTALGVVQTLAVAALLWAAGLWTVNMAWWSTSAWITPEAPGAEPGWSARWTDALTSLWHDIPALLAGGFVVSAYFAGSTIAYLLVRELNDGQDAADLWQPGMVESTLAPRTPEGQAAAAAEDEDNA